MRRKRLERAKKMKVRDYFSLLWLRESLARMDSDEARKAVMIIDKKLNLENF